MRNTINEACAVISDFKTLYGLVSEDGSVEQLLKSFIDKLCVVKSGMRDIKNHTLYEKIINGLIEKPRGSDIGNFVRFCYFPYSQRYTDFFDDLVIEGVIIFQNEHDILIMNFNEITRDFEFGSYDQGWFGIYGRGYDMEVKI